MAWICTKCFNEDTGPPEFATQEALAEHDKKVHSGAKVKEKPVRSDTVKPLPPIKERKVDNIEPKTQTKKVELVYRWIGQCPNCGVEIETIPLDVDARTKNMIIVAWCGGCREKKAQREVLKL